MSLRHLPSWIPLLMLVMAGLFAATLIMSVAAIRGTLNDQARTEGASLLSARLEVEHRALADVATDYSAWTEAWQMLRRGNIDWIYDNFAASADLGAPFDRLILFGGPLDRPLSWSVGQGAAPQPSPLPPERLAAIAADLAGRADDAALLWMDVEGGVLRLSVAQRVRPERAEAALPDHRHPISLVSESLQPEVLAEMGRGIGLSALSVTAEPDLRPGRVSLPLSGPDGATVGHLGFTPSAPGDAMVAAMRPVLTFVVLAFSVLAAIGAWVGARQAHRLLGEKARASALARTDVMTGLPNRLAMKERLARLEQAPGNGALALVFIDLNGFKRINDTLGHAVGDEVVRAIGQRLGALAAPHLGVTRLGGDEFALVLDGPESAAAVIRATEALSALTAVPIRVQGQDVSIAMAIGVALRDDRRIAIPELLRRADVAMYHAKRNRLRVPCLYAPALEQQTRRDIDLAAQLRRALESGEGLHLHYQPILTAGTHRLHRAEALLRWTLTDGNPVAPDSFIPVAEEQGLIRPLGNFVRDRLCADLAAVPWLSASLNASPMELQHQGFVPDLAAALAAHGVDPARIEVEVTEGVIVSEPERAALQLDAMHDIGVSTALDDFGTGYSSLGYLRRMPFRTLKIDRSYLIGNARGDIDRRLLRALIEIGQAMRMNVTCEGVETEAQARLVSGLGATHVQGYHFGRPQPLSDLMVRWAPLPVQPPPLLRQPVLLRQAPGGLSA